MDSTELKTEPLYETAVDPIFKVFLISNDKYDNCDGL